MADGFNVVGRKLLTTLLALRESGGGGNRLSAAADAETSLISQREEGGRLVDGIDRKGEREAALENIRSQ